MKLIIREHVNCITEVRTKTFDVVISAIESYGKIPKSIGQQKGDLIVFNDANSPVRFPSGNVPDKVIMTDPTSPTGWKLGTVSGGSGSGGTQTVTLINNTGATILSGTVVVLNENGNEREIRKAKSSDTGSLFITAADSETGQEVECYGIPNTICTVLCNSGAIAVGDMLAVSSNDGLCQKSSINGSVGLALTAKSSGNIGYVKVLLNCFSAESSGKNFTVSTTDLEDGVSALATDHFWYYYQA